MPVSDMENSSKHFLNHYNLLPVVSCLLINLTVLYFTWPFSDRVRLETFEETATVVRDCPISIHTTWLWREALGSELRCIHQVLFRADRGISGMI